MNRYAQTFKKLKAAREAALVAFAPAGDPDPRTSEAVFKTYLDAGADVLEIGYPFSDPVADGPVNQRAAARAIAAGLDHRSFFSLAKKLRAYGDAPMGVLMYANSLLHPGVKNFCDRAADSGIDSILVADMPPEEAPAFIDAATAAGIATAFIVSELTPPERIRYICAHTTGFVYVVSRLGTTGVRATLNTAVSGTLDRLRAYTRLPLCVGFGLSTPKHVREAVRAGADGAIIGSALVAQIEANLGRPRAMLAKLGAMTKAFKAATSPAGPKRTNRRPVSVTTTRKRRSS